MEQADINKAEAEAEKVLRGPDSQATFKAYLAKQPFHEGSRTPGMYAAILSYYQGQDRSLLSYLKAHPNSIYLGALKRALHCFGFSELAREIRGHKSPAKRRAINTSREEREAIIDSISKLKFKLMAKIQHETGCRAAEVISLKREDIGEGEEGRITIQVRTKGDKKMTYYLTLDTSAFLLAWLQDRAGDSYLFRDDSLTLHTNYCYYWSAVKKAAEPVLKGRLNEKFYPHGFRYGLAFDMFKSGANLLDVKEALGHADISTTTIYLQGSARKSLENIKKLREEIA